MSDISVDYLVIGAGPAGLQLARLLETGGHDYLVVEAADAPGSTFATFPRHRRLISINKPHTGSDDPEFNLRMDWNSLLSEDPELLFTKYSERYFPDADDYVRYLTDFAAAYALRIRYGSRIVRVARDGPGFTVTDDQGRAYRTRRVVVATGVSRPNIPPIPGIETAEQYSTVSVDPREFTGQRVLIIGKGNSALETANNLLETAAVIHVAGPSPLKFAWKTHFVGHVRAVNNNFLDTVQLKSQNALLDARVVHLEKKDDAYRVQFKFTVATVEHTYDRVIVCTGFRFDPSIFDENCLPRLALDDRFPELTPAYESADVPGLYFAGTLTQQLDFKKSSNGFIHGFRYAARALYHVLEQRHHDRLWPHRELPAFARDLAAHTVSRINRSSGLYQQYGNLADLLVVGSAGPARYYEELPVGYLHDDAFDHRGHAFAITLEYGPDDDGDPFTPRLSSAVLGKGYIDGPLHPVVRHYHRGELVTTLHLPDDLENLWTRPDLHVEPLEALFTQAVPAAAPAHR